MEVPDIDGRINNIMDIREVGWGHGLDQSGSE
jgi:hypothetical protein